MDAPTAAIIAAGVAAAVNTVALLGGHALQNRRDDRAAVRAIQAENRSEAKQHLATIVTATRSMGRTRGELERSVRDLSAAFAIATDDGAEEAARSTAKERCGVLVGRLNEQHEGFKVQYKTVIGSLDLLVLIVEAGDAVATAALSLLEAVMDGLPEMEIRENPEDPAAWEKRSHESEERISKATTALTIAGRRRFGGIGNLPRA